MWAQDTVLVWNENMAFGWQYYTGRMPEWKKNTMAVASTCYDLSVEFPDSLNVCVEAHFHSDCSWALPDFRTPDILRHEKLHFDIVELFARRLRKKISESVFTNAADALRKIKIWHRRTEKEMDRFQDRYDHETYGSMHAAMQKKWEEKVLKELDTFKTYAGLFVRLKIKSN
jgi:hypothetical protein